MAMSTALQSARWDGGGAGGGARGTVALGRLRREDWERRGASSPSNRRTGLAKEEH